MLGHEAQQEAIEGIIKRFDIDMVRVILEVEKLIAKWMLTNNVTATTSLQFDLMIDQALTESGYYALVNRLVGTDFDKLYPMIKEGFALGGLFITYTKEDLTRITALKALEANKFSVLASTASTTLRDNLYKYSLSNYSVEDMASQIQKDFAGTNLVKHSKTLANTVVSEMQQTTIDLEASDLEGMVWVYRGVQDGITRDYCNCILDKKQYYNDSEKNIMQSDSRRRYNCRHKFRPVTEDYAIEEYGLKKASGVVCK